MDKKELKRIIQIQKQGGASLEEAKTIISHVCDNGTQEQSLLEVELVYGKSIEKSVSERINEFISVTDRDFTVTNCDKECHIVTERDKTNRRQVLHRLIEAGNLIKQGKREGVYRRADVGLNPMDYENADTENVVPILLPFGFHKWVHIYPRNTILLAGDNDSGKSAFCINTALLNQDGALGVDYFNAEMGAEEFKKRLSKSDMTPTFRAWERDRNFVDVIRPDGLNIIDYLKQTKDFWLIGDEIKNIVAKLRKGIAVIAIQKKTGAEYGYGADTTTWDSRLYLSMSYNRQKKLGTVTVLKAKNPTFEGFSIKDLSWDFILRKGIEFDVVGEPPEIAEPIRRETQ